MLAQPPVLNRIVWPLLTGLLKMLTLTVEARQGHLETRIGNTLIVPKTVLLISLIAVLQKGQIRIIEPMGILTEVEVIGIIVLTKIDLTAIEVQGLHQAHGLLATVDQVAEEADRVVLDHLQEVREVLVKERINKQVFLNYPRLFK